MAICKIFSPLTSEILEELKSVVINAETYDDINLGTKKLNEYITESSSQPIEDRVSLIWEVLSSYIQEEFGQSLDENNTRQIISNTLEGTSKTNETTDNKATISNDFTLNDDIVLDSDLSNIFLSISDQNLFKRIFRNSLVNKLFIGSEMRNTADSNQYRVYKFNQSDVDLNIALEDYKNELFNDLINYHNSLISDKIDNSKLYIDNKFNQETYDDVISKIKRLFTENLANNEGKWYSDSYAESRAFYKFLFLTNFDNFLESQFDHLIKIDRAYSGTHRIPLGGSKYSTDINLNLKQDWNNQSEDIYSHTNQGVGMFLSSLKMLDQNFKETDSYLTLNNFQNILKVLSENSDSFNWWTIRQDPYQLKQIFDKIHANKNGELNKIFTKLNKNFLPVFNTIYHNIFDSNNPQSLESIYQSMEGMQNDLYSMILNHINKTSPIYYLKTIFDKDTGSYSTVELDSFNLSPKKKYWEDHIIVNAKKSDNSELLSQINFNTVNGVFESVNFNIGNLNINSTLKASTDSKQGKNKFNLTHTVNNTEITNFKNLFTANPTILKNFFSKALKKNLDDTFWTNLLNISTETQLSGLMDLAVASLISYDLGKELQEEFNNNYTYDQLKNKILSKYSKIVSSKDEFSFIQPEINMIKPGSLFKSLNGLELLATTTSLINGDYRKSYVVNMDKGKLPKFRLSALMNNDKYLFNSVYSPIFQHNMFGTDKSFDAGSYLKTDFTNSEGDYVSAFEMSPTELLYSQFVGDYLALSKTGKVGIQPLNYADKSNIWLKLINTSGLINGIPLGSAKSKQLRDYHYESMQKMFLAFSNKIVKDYNQLFTAYNELFQDTKIVLPKSKSILKNITEYQKLLSELNIHKLNAIILHIQETDPDFKFVQEIHGSIKGSTIKSNPVLNKNLAMYLGTDQKAFDKSIEYQKKLYAYNLYSNHIKFQNVDDYGVENQLLKGASNSKWLNKSLEEWINFKLYKDGNEVDAELTLDNLNDFDIVLHPELDKFFELDNLITDHYTAATFGLAQSSPSKYKLSSTAEDLRKNEASRTSDMYKRGVIAGATIHPFMKHKKDGIPDKYKIAVIQDNSFPTLNLQASNEIATVYDGGIWLDPMTAIWEANSSPGLALSSVHRKPIGYVGLQDYMTSMLLKCATFSLNNELMRSSHAGEIKGEDIFRNMSGMEWTDKDLTPLFDLDLTEQYNMSYDDLYYMDENLQRWKIHSIEKVDGLDSYERIKTQVNNIGQEIGEPISESIIINSNYTLWQALGGKFSMKQEFNKLIYSEFSIEEAAKIASLIEVDNYQPLKNSNINYLANESAVKKGVTNLNSVDSYFNANKLTYTRVDPDFIGIQMNADHHIDDAEMSAPTQVISALVQQGISYELANEIYEDLGVNIMDSLELGGLINKNYDTEESKTELYKILGKNLLRVFSNNSDSMGLTQTYLNFVKSDLLSNKNLSEQQKIIPFDDPNIFNKFYSGFNSTITSDIIKQKFSGLGAVLNPAHDLATLYDFGETQITYGELVKHFNTKEELDEYLQDNIIQVQAGEVRHGDIIDIESNGIRTTYRVGGYYSNGETHGRFPLIGLGNVRDLRQTDSKIFVRGDLGRNLRPQNTSFEIESTNSDTKFDLFDLDVSKLSYNLIKILDSLDENGLSNENDLIHLIYNDVYSRIESDPMLDENKFINFIKLYKTTTNKEVKNNTLDQIKLYLNKLLQQDLNDVAINKFRLPIQFRTDQIYANITSLTNTPNEMMLGRPWATKFGLRSGDDVSSIVTNGSSFFKNRLLESYKNDLLPEEYDLHFHNFSEKDFFLKAMTNIEEINKYISDNNELYNEVKATTILASDNKIYRVNQKGNSLYEFNPETMKIVVDKQGREIILCSIDDIYKFNTPQEFDHVSISNKILESPVANKLKEFIESGKLFSSKTKKLINLGDMTLYNQVWQEDIEELAQKKAVSFRQALNFIVSRIPAQSMQSFMNMRIASFIEADTNIVYVPIEQLIYQGSDYDIDKAYILGASVNKQGVYYSWSPYFSFKDDESFNLSHKLPMPNGKMYQIQNSNNTVNEELVQLIKEKEEFINKVELLYQQYIQRSEKIINVSAREKAINSAEKYRTDKLEGLEINKINNKIKELEVDIKNNKTIDITEQLNQLMDGVDLENLEVYDIERFANLLKTIYSANIIQANLDEETLVSFNQLINKHTTYKMQKTVKSEALKNKIYHAMWTIGQDVKNTLLQTSPITMGPARNRASNSLSGKYSDYLSNSNPGTRMIQQAQNSIGKKSIGINATGIKVLSALISYYQTKLSTGNIIRLQNGSSNQSPTGNWEYKSNGKTFNLKFAPTLTNVNWDLINLPELQKEQANYNNVPEDVFLTISVLLSASTDNAKELILEKINASPELAGVYIYALTGGVTFENIARFMTTPEVTAVALKAKSNILYKNDINNSIPNAVSYFLNGLNNLEDYFDNANPLLNLLIEKYGSEKKIPWTDENFPQIIETLGKSWEVRNSAGSDMAKRISSNKQQKLSEEEQEIMDEIMSELDENAQSRDRKVIKDFDKVQLNRYIRDLKERVNLIKSLDIKNIQVLGELSSKSKEMTLLGGLLSLNQGVKSKMADKINYIWNINKQINRKLNWKQPFDFMQFLSSESYRQSAINSYENAKDTFNVLDIISTVPHFKAMTQALVVSETIPNQISLRAKLIPNLAKNMGTIIGDRLLPKHISTINHYITDTIVNKFLDNSNLKILNLNKQYIGSDLLETTENEQTLNFRKSEDRMTFKNWFETNFVNELKEQFPNNSFIQDLGFGYYRNRVNSSIYTLLKLPINLDNVEKESNEVLYSNYLKDFNKLRFDKLSSNPSLDIGDMFYLYNLIVNKNKPGESSLTKIFEDYLNVNNKEETKMLQDHNIIKFMEFESSFMFSKNTLEPDEDYDLRDLAIRLLQKDQQFKQSIKGKEHTITKKFNSLTKKFQITDNNQIIEFTGEDNTTDLPFYKEDYDTLKNSKLREVLTKILNLHESNNLEIKLKCE